MSSVLHTGIVDQGLVLKKCLISSAPYMVGTPYSQLIFIARQKIDTPLPSPFSPLSPGSPIVSALCTVLEQVCPYFVPPAGPAMSKLALTALHWSIIASKHCQDANDIIVNVQVIIKKLVILIDRFNVLYVSCRPYFSLPLSLIIKSSH